MLSYLTALNQAAPEDVAVLLEGVVERSPWVLEKLHTRRPFVDIAALQKAIEEMIWGLPLESRKNLALAHPELADTVAAKTNMTSESHREQDRLGLLSLSKKDQQRLRRLNTDYRNRFGFPFIIALESQSDLQSVFTEFEKRLASEAVDELDAATAQTVIVARSRVAELAEAYALSHPSEEFMTTKNKTNDTGRQSITNPAK